jgi:hypothetical protein
MYIVNVLIGHFFPDQRGRRKFTEGGERQEECVRRQRHRQEVKLEADGAAAGGRVEKLVLPRH